MEKESIVGGRDRAELIFMGSIPDGDCSRDVEVLATERGLLLDESMLVPWGWIQNSYEILLPEGAGPQPSHPSTDIASDG